MATRGTIAKENPDGTINRTNGTITSIYVHWDSYPAGVGATLAQHYTDAAKIDALMALGDLSVLGAEIGSKKDFDTGNLNGECLAYSRDRGENDVEAKMHLSREKWLAVREDQGCEFAYLWNGSAWETSTLY